MKKRHFLSLAALAIIILLSGCARNMNVEPKTVSVEVTVPDSAWRLSIDEVYTDGDRLLVVSTLERDRDAIAAQVISKISDSVRISAPDLPVEHYILGKTWSWAEEDHQFLDSRKALKKELENAQLIFRKPE